MGNICPVFREMFNKYIDVSNLVWYTFTTIVDCSVSQHASAAQNRGRATIVKKETEEHHESSV